MAHGWTKAPATPTKSPGEWAAEGETYDCTGHIGPLFPEEREPAWPMYPYYRPGSILWNAIAKELNARGWKDERIKEWLQSKNPRWALDGDLGEMIEMVGKMYARGVT